MKTFPPGDPIVSAEISSDGHYAFVEFRTPEEANQGFALNNIAIMGQPLKVGRPKTYQGVFMMDDISMNNSVTAVNPVAAVLQAGTMKIPELGRKVQFPTKILCFKKIVDGINIDDESKYKEISEDIKIECSKYGKVLDVFMPRKDIDDNILPGNGNCYVEFSTVDECKQARKCLVGSRFNNRIVTMVYFSEDKYKNRDFSEEDSKIIEMKKE